jgi:AsmA protein
MNATGSARPSSAVQVQPMRRRWRAGLYAILTLLLLSAGLAWWLMQGFDGERAKRAASDWMQTHHGRTLVFDGPLVLQLWPQPALAAQRVRLSEPGQPQQPFASIDGAALSLRLKPLLSRREIEVDSVSAHGVSLRLARDAQGRRNIDDLLELLARGDKPGSGEPFTMDRLELADVQLQIDDAQGGVQGRLAIARLELGAFGPGLVSPLHLHAKADLSEPPLSAALQLDAGLALLPTTQTGAPPVIQLDKSDMRLRGQGFDLEGLDARLRSETIRLELGAERGLGDSRVEIREAQLQFGGRRLGWQIDRGQLELARLQLDTLQRKLELERLAVQLKGRRDATTIDSQLRWPALAVHGERLHGSALEGAVQMGGNQRLQLQLRSQAPSGVFERITVPALQLAIDGQLGSSALTGEAGATLVFEPTALAAELDALKLRLRLDDPAQPPLQIALDGQARLTPDAASGRLEGTLNDQRLDARLDARLDRPRALIDLQADIGTLDLTRFVAPPQRGAAPAPAGAATPIDLQPLRWADARLRIHVARLLHPPYRVDGLQIEARIDDGVLDLRRLAGRAWGGRFDASGRADAGNGGLALRLRADEIDMRAMLADATGNDGLRGRARIEADLQGRGATVGALRAALNGTARMSLRPAALRGVDLAQTLRGWRTAAEAGSDAVASDAARQTDFSQLEGSFEVRNGVARNTDLDGRSDFLRVGGEGTVDLRQGRVDYLLRARVVNTASGRAGPEMVLLNGVTVPVELHGPFGNIEWQVRWVAVTAAMAALSVPNVALGTVGTVTRGATGVVRGATGIVRGAAGTMRGGPGGAGNSPR